MPSREHGSERPNLILEIPIEIKNGVVQMFLPAPPIPLVALLGLEKGPVALANPKWKFELLLWVWKFIDPVAAEEVHELWQEIKVEYT